MPKTASEVPAWPGVSDFEVARLIRRGRARGRLTLDEVIDVVCDAELTSELISGIRTALEAEARQAGDLATYQPSISFLRNWIMDLREVFTDFAEVEPLLRWLVNYSEGSVDA